MKTLNTDLLNEMYQQVANLDEGLLFSGLTVVAKDAAEYMAARGLYDEATQSFQQNYAAVMGDERNYWEKHGSPLYHTLQEEQLPNGMARAAENGKAELLQLSDPGLHHEWLHFPGQKFLKKFGEKWKKTLCEGEDSPYHKLENGLLGQAELPVTIAASILTVGFAAATFFYPLALYIGLLLVKTGFKVYCEKNDD